MASRLPRGGYIDLEKFRYREWTPALRAAGIPIAASTTFATRTHHGGLAADVSAAIPKMIGTSIAQIEEDLPPLLREDEERNGTALDSYRQASVSSFPSTETTLSDGPLGEREEAKRSTLFASPAPQDGL